MDLKSIFKAPFGIFGRGLSGRATERLLHLQNYSSKDVFLFDEKSISSDETLSSYLIKHNIQTLVVSPGVPLTKPEIIDFKKKGGAVTSELEIAWSFLENEKVLCVTGSVGKSTVVALLNEGIKTEDPNTFLGGNFGFPLADYVSDVLEGKRPRAHWITLELSSYQLENFPSLISNGTIITSLLKNHLERYPSKEIYYDTKWSLVNKTQGPVVLNQNGEDLKGYSKTKSNSSALWTDATDHRVPKKLFENSPLLGSHNKDNLAMAYTLLHACGFSDSILGPMSAFTGLPHRVENCGVRDGILFVNDSKATTISSVFQAVTTIESRLAEGGKMHLLLGGRDKNLPWSDLRTLNRSSIVPYFFGEFAENARDLSKLPGNVYSKLGPALQVAFKSAKKGDIVLLSPGGSSLDEFKSFEDRGNYFKAEVAKWSPNPM